MRTSAVQINDVDLYRVSIEDKKVDRFLEIVKSLQEEKVIFEESIQGFRVVARKKAFKGAMELKSISRVRTAFKDAFINYDNPYAYLHELLLNDSLAQSELYKLFTNIGYTILNKDGFEVSGGERSEFRLLQEIKDAQNYDILLIDEPESSFDNLFLKSDVNSIIKEISASMPVVLVTHNNTVGASIGADYILYASKEIEDGDIAYKLYSGYPTDSELKSIEGNSVTNYDITLNSLEAGLGVYNERREGYEAIKN